MINVYYIKEFPGNKISLLITDSGNAKSGFAGFNVAENMALSSDLEAQAEHLISKIKRSNAADLREDWKVTKNT